MTYKPNIKEKQQESLTGNNNIISKIMWNRSVDEKGLKSQFCYSNQALLYLKPCMCHLNVYTDTLQLHI